MTLKRNELLTPKGFRGLNFNIKDLTKFQQAVQLLQESLNDEIAITAFCADNLITWNKNFSFLREDFYLDILNSKNITNGEKSIIWRTYILLYFCNLATNAQGDFMEIGCYRGTTALQVVKKIDFKKTKKSYYLYDLFSWSEGAEHTHHLELDNPKMYENILERFSAFPFVNIIKGSIPESFNKGIPDKVAFAHIDMNHPEPESRALEIILPKLSRGGIIVLDDYGWWSYSGQKLAMDPIASKHNLEILELPTGQGLLIKS